MSVDLLDDKKKRIENSLRELRKKSPNLRLGFGETVATTFFPTPFVTLNKLNGGGVPYGKFGTIAGPEQTGKGTLLLQIIAHAQSLDPDFIALWTDAEGAFEEAWARQLGVDMDRLLIQEYDTEHCVNAETLLEAGLSVIKSQAIDLWVVDSLGALLPKSEDEKTMSEQTMMEVPRIMSKFYRKACKSIAPDPSQDFKGTATIFVGQVYSVPTTHPAGLEAVKGGNAVKHWAHYRWKTRRGNRDEGPGMGKVTFPDGTEKPIPVGWAQRIKLEKTRINGLEGQEVLLQFRLGRGLDSIHSAITALFANEIFERSGGWIKHDLLPDGKIQGKDKLVDLLSADEDLRNKLISLMDEDLVQHAEKDSLDSQPSQGSEE